MHSVTVRQLVRVLGVTAQTVYTRAKAEGWRAVGSRPRAWDLSSLPPGLQALVTNNIPTSPSLRREEVCPPDPARLPAVLQPPLTPDPAQDLTPSRQSLASQRAALVQAYRQCLDTARREGRPLVPTREQFEQSYNAGLIHPGLRQDLGAVSWQTVERWSRALQRHAGDYRCLTPRQGDHRRGQSKVTAEEAAVLQRCLLHQHRLPINSAIELARYELKRLGYRLDSSPSTMRRWVERYQADHADLWTLMRKGRKALIDEVLPTIRRDRTLLQVGDVLIADGHKCNFRVLSPYTGKPVRPVLIGWQDWRSAYICGWSLMFSEDICAIHLALQRAVLTLGRAPVVAYLDNGKAFKARFFTDPDSVDFEDTGTGGLYARLGTRVAFAQAYNPQSKPIESFFRTLSLQFEKTLSSYSGGSIAEKPARLHRNERFMQRLAPERVLELAEVEELLQGWLDHYYHTRPHSGQGLEGQCPQEVFASGKGPGVDPERLRFLLLASKTVLAKRSSVELFGQQYVSEELYGLRDRVFLRYDLHDLRQVHVYRTDGSFVCTAPRATLAHPMLSLATSGEELSETAAAPDSLAVYKEQRKRQKRLERSTKEAALHTARSTAEAHARLLEQQSLPQEDATPADTAPNSAPNSSPDTLRGLQSTPPRATAPRQPAKVVKLVDPTNPWADLSTADLDLLQAAN